MCCGVLCCDVLWSVVMCCNVMCCVVFCCDVLCCVVFSKYCYGDRKEGEMGAATSTH